MGKTDSTGTYSYLCDGATPGSSVLSDGAAIYTPGQSEHRAGASSYPDFDSLGNILTMDAGSGNVTQAGYLVTGFGTPLYTTGSSPTPFKYGGANGCQTEADTGLVLMGHRYYDTRIGRFITQDPKRSGNNWYAYAENDPVRNTDPTGLETPLYHNLGGDAADGTGEMDSGAFEAMSSLQHAFDDMIILEYNHVVDYVNANHPKQLTSQQQEAIDNLIFLAQPVKLELNRWTKFATPATQYAARSSIFANWVDIYGGVQYIRNPTPGFGNNVSASFISTAGLIPAAGGIIGGLGIMEGSGTLAASIYGGAAVASGVGAVAVLGTAATIGAYRASDYWVNHTNSGQAVTDTLGIGLYNVEKFVNGL